MAKREPDIGHRVTWEIDGQRYYGVVEDVYRRPGRDSVCWVARTDGRQFMLWASALTVDQPAIPLPRRWPPR